MIVRFRTDTGEVHLGLTESDSGEIVGVTPGTLADLLTLPAADLRARLATAASAPPSGSITVLAPIDGETEVWAAGVTYKRSADARVEESSTPDIYTRVYQATRPEIFFKATARRVAGPGASVVVRSDSTWDVPEPEVAIVVNAHAEIVGYTIANDVSSRSIEGDNPLYLPQAKVYDGSCALGPGIVPAWEVADPYALGIRMRIHRSAGLHWSGETSMREFARRLDDLVAALFVEDTFPNGVILSTGTALVPDSPFTLEAGDEVEIEIDSLGSLRNPVVRGKAARHGQRGAKAV
jgi:2-dehydro-3-deoxy-D-arabinonate dehydratase